MARSLVIVESPAKAKTINKYLGRDYVVRSSVGHIRDLPVGGSTTDARDRAREAARTKAVPVAERAAYKARRAREQLIRRMGVDPQNGWEAQYQILPGKEKVVAELARLAQTADTVYLATDMDREGEAIAWHLRETIGGDPGRYKRVVFNEITRNAIREAFADPGELNMNRVNAQQARRFLDRVVGFELSPLLWAKVARGLSAGRVQSVAVRLVVEREREIRAFIPEEYWEAFADLARAGADAAYRFQLVKFEGANFRPDNGDAAATALARLRLGGFKVTQREDRPTRTRPNAPFITSTLQQAASTRLGFSVKKTMTLAQRLYEAGHITYMRTDSTNLSAEAVGSARDFIHRTLGDAYLPDKARLYASKKDAQEAHEAIRPSNVGTEARHLTDMEADAQRLYDLIWRQFVACQMPDAEYISTTVTAEANQCEVRLRGRILTFDGYTRVLPPQGRKDEDLEIPDFAAGEALDLRGAETIQHFTKPPPRYGEASLVRELEKRSIGRPSTYAAIISTIQERGYVTLQNRRFYAEKIGELVTDRLLEKFDNLMDYGFTAEMEAELDRIAEGDLPWRKVLDEFYGDFENKLDNARQEKGGMRANDPTDTDIACPACGRHMQVRTGSTGVFLGCSGYALPPKERCTHTLNLIPGEEAIDVEADEEGESRLLRSRQRCPRCSAAMTPYLIDEGRKLHVCGNNPDCGGFVVEAGNFRIKGYDGPVIACEKCGSDMQLKSGRFGKYFGCTKAACGNTRKLLRNGQAAPPKADPIPMPELRCEKVDDFYLLRDGASGLFLAASQFPKHRETRAPLIRELKSHANELDPKFAYLLSAPEADGEGRPAVLRFSRKTREQYVQSEEEGKPTGWRAFYVDGRWVESRGGASGQGDDAADGAAPKRRGSSLTRSEAASAGRTRVRKAASATGSVSKTGSTAKSPARKKAAVKATAATNKPRSKATGRVRAGASEE